jgi:hypothetical protein
MSLANPLLLQPGIPAAPGLPGCATGCCITAWLVHCWLLPHMLAMQPLSSG